MASKNGCPGCGADDTASIEVVYLSQTRTSRSSLIGIDGDGDLGVGSISGTSTSLLGSAIAPPAKRSNSLAFCIMLIGFVGGALILLMGISFSSSRHANERSAATAMFVTAAVLLIIGGLAIPSLRAAGRFNGVDWPKLYDRWRRQWFCRRCGYRWTPGAAAGSPAPRNDPIPENFGRTVESLDDEIARNLKS